MKEHFEAIPNRTTELNVLEKVFCTDGLPQNMPNSPYTHEIWKKLFCQQANTVPFKFGVPKRKSEDAMQ